MSDELRGKRKITLIVATILATALASIGGLYYYTMHNTFIYSFIIADDRIITSDGRGLYREGIYGVFYGRDEEIFLALLSLNASSRSVRVKFTQTLWKDSNLRDVPSMLPSKDYRMMLYFSVNGSEGKPIDFYKMHIGHRYESPQLQVQLYFNDYDTGAFQGLYAWREQTIEEPGPSQDFIARQILRYYNVWLPTKTPEPPQSLRDDSHMTLTRVSDEKWALDVNAWFLTYHRAIHGDILKYYVKLSLYLTISRHMAM